MLRSLLVALSFATLGAAQFSNPFFGRGVWRGEVVDFRIVDGWALVEGDIIAGPASELAARYQALHTAPATRTLKDRSRESLVISDQARLWPGGIVPYEVDPAIKDTTYIEAAIRHWNQRTTLKIVSRSGETDYVKIAPGQDPTVCSSALGMRGGMQLLMASETCPTHAIIHEIGHAVGLLHEQARSDRDRYLRVFWENVAKPALSQYAASAPATDYGPYDYYSIMHYQGSDFTKNGLVTLESRPPGIPFGSTLTLSDGDIDAVNRLYGKVPQSVTIGSTPPGLQVIVDGEAITTPRSFEWVPDSIHTMEAPSVQTDTYGRYEYARWSDNGDRAHSITVKPDATLFTANFVRYNRFSLAVTPQEGGTIRLSPDSADGLFRDLYRDDTLVTFTAVPAPGYVFANWEGPYIDNNPGARNLPLNPLSLYAHAGLQGLTARFVPAPAVTSGPSNRPITRFTSVLTSGRSTTALIRIDGRLYNTPVSFTWEPGSKHDVDIANVFPVTEDLSLRSFRSWNDGTDRVRQVIAGEQPGTYTATYAIQYALFPAPVGPGNIRLIPESSTFFYDQGSTVELNAIPIEGNQFAGWGNDLGGIENPKTVVLRESLQPIAFFGSTTAVSNFAIMNTARWRPNTQIVGNSIFAKISPGEVVTINMQGVGPEEKTDGVPTANGSMPTSVAETRVLVGRVPVPVISASKGQVTAFIPYEASVLVGRAIGVQIEYQGQITGEGFVAVVAANPAIYTDDGSGSGQGKVINEDGSANGPNSPARKGSVVSVLASGLGVASGSTPRGELEVRIGGAVAEVVSKALATGQLGIYRIEVRVPDAARAGSATALILTLDGAPSQVDVTMAVE